MQGAVLGCTCVLTRAFPKLGRILPHRKPTETGLWLVRREKRSGSIAFLAALEMLQFALKDNCLSKSHNAKCQLSPCQTRIDFMRMKLELGE